MSLVDLVRDAALDSKKKESAICVTSRKRKLRELYAYTSYVIHGIPKNHDFVVDLPPSADESRFLDENDIVKGRYFAEATIPFPQNASILQTLPNSSRLDLPLPASSSPAPPNIVNTTPGSDERHQRPVQATPDAEQPAVGAGEAEDHMAKVQKGVYQPPSEKCNESVNSRKSAQLLQKPVASGNATESDHQAEHLPVPPDEPGINPSEAVPPAPEDLAALDAPVTPDADSDNKDRPAKVVHLPPKEVQERHLREIEHAQENARRKEKKEDEKLGLSAEAASSPSSTLGTHSTFTPRPTQHSPDTSPDVEAFPGGSTRLRSTNEALPTKENAMQEEHDRVLHSQMEKARAQARGNSPTTPDAQLRLEEEQAIRAARDFRNLPELAPGVGQRNASPVGPAATEVAEQLATSRAQDDAREKGLTESRSENTSVNSLPTHNGKTRTPGSPQADGTAIGSTNANDSVAVKSEHAPGVSNGHAVVATNSSPLAGRGVSHAADISMPDAPTAADERLGFSHLPSTPSRPANTESTIEKRTTRVASGAIRQKSVSEILGGPPRVPASQPEPRPASAGISTSATDVDGLLASTPSKNLRTLDASEKSNTSPIAVSSHGQNNSVELLLSASEDYAALRGASLDGKRDYLEPLYVFQAEQEPRATPLRSLVETSNKTLTTANQLAAWRENQEYKILKRIYQLQNVNRWPLRQMEKSPELPCPTTHLDHLLGQMKWTRTDVTEGRRWRTTAAHAMAAWCAEWVASDPQERLRLQVKVKPLASRGDNAQHQEPKDKAPSAAGGQGEIISKTPDLEPSAANENDSDGYPDEQDTPKGLVRPRARTGLFSLGYDEVMLQVDKTPANNDIFLKIPSYESLTYDFSSDIPVKPSMEPPIVPVSKLVTGKVVCKPARPPRKRSRYDYEDEEDSIAAPSPKRRHYPEHLTSTSPNLRLHRAEIPPEQTDVALFNPENKHVRDRLHASHAFRPPSEFPMPATSFFEARWSSQWLWEEDQKLRSLVKEYSYNWSLISDSLSLPSMFTSGAERRTPWECFERWVQLEGLPPDMSKTQYFRTYQSRLEAAQRTVLAQYQAAQQQMQQQAQTPGQAIPVALRRRTSQPIRVERRKNNRYLAIIDGMRKLARKRETAAHKQQEAAKAAALRKAHEAVQPKPNIHTPQEFSRIRHERDLKMQERQEQYRLHMNAQRNAAMQRAGQAPGQQQPLPAGVAQQPRNGTPNGTHGPSPLGNPPAQMGNPQAGVNGQARQHLQPPGLPNGMAGGAMGGMQMGTQGIPQAQMQQAQIQANMQGQARLQAHNSADLRMAMQQRVFNQQQQSMQQQQQQQHLNQPGNLATAHMGPANASMQNPAMLAAMAGQRVNGAANGLPSPAGNSVSPRMGQHNPVHGAQPQPLSSGHVPAVSQISHQIQAQNPSLSPDQVRRLTNEHLKGQVYQQSRQSALNAAAGASAAGPMTQISQNSYQHNGNLPGSGSPTQHYQQQLRQRMLQQQPSQHMGSPGMNNGRPPSRSATPQGPPLQHVGSGSVMQDQHSPGPLQAQMNRNPS